MLISIDGPALTAPSMFTSYETPPSCTLSVTLMSISVPAFTIDPSAGLFSVISGGVLSSIYVLSSLYPVHPARSVHATLQL